MSGTLEDIRIRCHLREPDGPHWRDVAARRRLIQEGNQHRASLEALIQSSKEAQEAARRLVEAEGEALEYDICQRYNARLDTLRAQYEAETEALHEEWTSEVEEARALLKAEHAKEAVTAELRLALLTTQKAEIPLHQAVVLRRLNQAYYDLYLLVKRDGRNADFSGYNPEAFLEDWFVVANEPEAEEEEPTTQEEEPLKSRYDLILEDEG